MHVLVVEDHAIVRECVRTLLEREPDIQVVGSVGSGEEAIEFLRNTTPHIVVMDVGLPGMSGIEATRMVREHTPDVHVLALTMYEDELYRVGMLDAGADGYVTKGSLANELVQAIRSVAPGQRARLSKSKDARDHFPGRPSARASSPASLTNHERIILRLIGHGYTTRDIASKLSLGVGTVKKYRAQILHKLDAKNCPEAVSRAVSQRIIEPVS